MAVRRATPSGLAALVVALVVVETRAWVVPTRPWSPKVVVGEWSGCVFWNTSDQDAALERLNEAFAWAGTDAAKQAAGCSLFCEFYDYMTDRCAAPRAVCAVSVANADYGYTLSSSIAHPAAYPAGTKLEAGTYVVVFGAASAIGTMVRRPFDERFTVEAGLPILNFGRGSGAPDLYLDDWRAIEPIVVNAAAVVFSVMAIRSSANSWCEYHNCTSAVRNRLWSQADAATRTIMEEESFNTSLAEQTLLLRLIEDSPLRQGSVPRRILLWHSACDPTRGCARSGDFPIWFHVPDRITRLRALAWDDWVDANYADAGDTRQYNQIPVDACDNFPGTDAAFMGECAQRDPAIDTVCQTSTFRNEVRSSRTQGCSFTCAHTTQYYYPIEQGHDNVYDRLLPVLQTAIANYTLN